MTNVATRRPTLVAVMAALLAASALLVVASPHPAGASISWSAVNPPLPADAVSGQGVSLVSASCPDDGWCIAVGDYPALTGTTNYEAALIDSESGGTWTATEAPLPVGASATDPQAFLQSVTCVAVGSCVAVGNYLDATGATQGLVEQLADGIWTPTTATLPAGAAESGSSAYARLTSVSCPGAGSCTALGVYTQSGGTELAFIDTYGGGAWGATTAPLPAPAVGSQFLSLSCPAVGSCVAVGTYLVGSSYLGVIETLSGGTWTATALPLPAGASPLASVANDDLWVSCPAVGSCTVAGTTFDGNYEGVLDTLAGGSWTAQSAPIPGDQSSTDVQLDSVSCADDQTCVATGLVTIDGVTQGLFESMSSGTWSASSAPVPAGTPATASIEIHGVACPADGTCVAQGQSDATGIVNGLFWNLSSGSWAVTPASLPSDAAASSDPSFAPLTCPGAGVCMAVGTYMGPSGREGVIDTDPSLAATNTAVSMTPLSGGVTAYAATVTGSAGQPAGTVVFSAGLDALCTATLAGGTATCTGPPASGATVLGSYGGDTAFAPSWGSVVNPGVPSAIYAVGGTVQSAKVGTWFPSVIQVRVVDASGVGVPGMAVTFTVPLRGASALLWGPATVATNAAGIASSSALSTNAKAGSYVVTATANGVPGAALAYLTNFKKRR